MPFPLAELPKEDVDHVRGYLIKYVDKCVDEERKVEYKGYPPNNLTKEDWAYLNGKLPNSQTDRDDKYRYSLIFKTIHAIVGDARVDIYLKTEDGGEPFLFYNLNWIKENYDACAHVVAVGHVCHGMGHYMVLFMVKRTGKFFIGMNGGANGHDRLYNDEFYKEFNPVTQFSRHFPDRMMYSLPNVLNILKEDGWFDEFRKRMIQMPSSWVTPSMREMNKKLGIGASRKRPHSQ